MHQQTLKMNKSILPWPAIPQLSRTDLAYATADPALRPFYSYDVDLQWFAKIISDKSNEVKPRELLAEILKEQYEKLGLPNPKSGIRNPESFTVVTAHQPTLFLSPMYFILKAITTINLCERVKTAYPDKEFIPVFVLGSEDHDLDELNHATVFNKKLVWQTEQTGSVGLMKTDSMQPVLAELKTILGDNENANFIYPLIEKAYSSGWNFAEATQFLLAHLLGKYGLIVFNMDDRRLKRLFIPIMREELLKQSSFSIVNQTISELNQAGFKTQAAPREINLFYRTPGRRERIVFSNGNYQVINTDLVFSESEILTELENSSEKFSPNVVLRPLFQELILPNLAYVGGGGELAYWLERKAQFEHFGINFPMLVRRNSLLFLENEATKKLEKFGFSVAEFFQETESLVRKFVEKQLAVEVGLTDEMEAMSAIFSRLAEKAKAIEPTLEKAVAAEQVKQLTALENWESKLRRAEKQKHEIILNQIRALKEKLYPNNGLQERSENWLTFYVKYGGGFFEMLKNSLDPFDNGFVVFQNGKAE